MAESALPALERAEEAAKRADLWAATDALRAALRAPGGNADAWAHAARLAEGMGDTFAAIGAARRFHQSAPRGAASDYFLASTLTEAGLAGEAAALMTPHAEAGALSADQVFKFTRMLSFAGRLEEAGRRARALLAASPASPTLWERIAQTKTFRPGDPDIDAMERILTGLPPSKPISRAAIARALAKAYVDIGDDRVADQRLEMRAEADRSRSPFDPAPFAAAARDIVDWCAAAPMEAPSAALAGSERAIFILGPPRSGTTLVEQIVSRHSRVEAGGERRHILIAGAPLGDFSARAVAAYLSQAGSQQAWRVIGARYLTLSEEMFGGGAFTDKLLSNHFRVRALMQALPQARIVYVRRNALDLGWSCWRAQFDADSPWSNSQAGIAFYIRRYREIMAAWAARYPGRISEVSYEALVRDPEGQIPRLLAACGLADEKETRAPQLAQRAVMTMSHAEVRQPINPKRADSARDFPLATRRLAEELGKAGIAD